MAFNIQAPGIDPSILTPPPSIGAMTQQGMQGYESGTKLRDMIKAKKFEAALTEELSTGAHDYKTPEGQASLVKALSSKGFGPEAMDLAAKFPKAAQKTYTSVETDQGLTSFDTETGKYGSPALGTDGNPLNSKKVGDANKKAVKLAAFQQDIADKYGAQAASIGTDVGKRNALVSEIYKKYGDLPEAKAFIDDTKNTPASIINLGNTGLSAKDKLNLENRFRVDWGKEKRSYETQAQAYLNLQGIKNSKTYGTGIGDQALVDEFVRLQTGGRPTEAQYQQSMSSFGIGDLWDRVSGKMKSGSKLPETVRKDIIAAANEQMKNNHERLMSLKDEKEQELRDSGGEPTHVFQSSKYFDQVGKYFKQDAPTTGTAHPQDSAMVKWAKENPSVPGATEVLKANGQ